MQDYIFQAARWNEILRESVCFSWMKRKVEVSIYHFMKLIPTNLLFFSISTASSKSIFQIKQQSNQAFLSNQPTFNPTRNIATNGSRRRFKPRKNPAVL